MKPQNIGSITVHKVTETPEFIYPMSFGFPDITWEQIESTREWLDERFFGRFIGDEVKSAKFALSFHSFVVQSKSRNILIDTCCGNHKNRPGSAFAHMQNGDYLDRLEKIGLTPGDIDAVLCTHLHFDHVGWNTRLQDGSWVPTFPKARYYFGRLEYETASKLTGHPKDEMAFQDSVAPVVAAGQAIFVEDRDSTEIELADGMWLDFERAPGHTAGNSIIHARGRGQHALFPGDVIHHPLQIGDWAISIPAEHDGETARRTRRRLIEAYADTDTIFFPAHFLDPTAGRVVSSQRGFRYSFLAT